MAKTNTDKTKNTPQKEVDVAVKEDLDLEEIEITGLVDNSQDAALQNELRALRERVSQLENEAAQDHVVLNGTRYLIKDGPCRADMVLENVRKGYIHENQTAITINRYE